MMWNWNGAGWWWWFVMPGGMLVFWGVVAWVVLQLVRGGSHEADTADPEAILAARLARGNIDPDEYQHRLEILRAGPGRRRA